ncbi:hypothetical protein ACVWZW_006759 [Bradyrhizobium sp. F1.13.4]
MSLSLSATGWSAAGTLLAAFTGSEAGAAAVAGAAGVSALAGSVFAVSLFGASAAGVVATSEGLVSTLFGAGAASAFTGSLTGSFAES